MFNKSHLFFKLLGSLPNTNRKQRHFPAILGFGPQIGRSPIPIHLKLTVWTMYILTNYAMKLQYILFSCTYDGCFVQTLKYYERLALHNPFQWNHVIVKWERAIDVKEKESCCMLIYIPYGFQPGKMWNMFIHILHKSFDPHFMFKLAAHILRIKEVLPLLPKISLFCALSQNYQHLFEKIWVTDPNIILNVLIHTLKTVWPTKLSMPFLSSLENLL